MAKQLNRLNSACMLSIDKWNGTMTPAFVRSAIRGVTPVKSILQTTTVIAAIAASIVIAMMAPKGFRLGPETPIIAETDAGTSELR